MLVSFCAGAQNCRYTLTGHIQDADTREKLSAATVVIHELDLHFVTDDNGDFAYNRICAGTYTIEVSHAGCETVRRTVALSHNMHLDLSIPHLRNNLQEVVVSAEKPSASPGFRQQLDSRAIESARGTSLAEALSKINGVNLLQTGSTIAKPVIHGLHSLRVLTINNGIRQEGQQWGSEHAPEIDTYLADKLTVVKGVDELKWGSDAIGGVVLVDPKPLRSLPGSRAELNTAWFTNNGQYVVSGVFEQQPKKWSPFSYRLQGTYKKSGNVMTPNYRLNNTGSSEQNFSAAADWKKEHYTLQAYYSQFATQLGIFPYTHVGNLSDLLDRIALARPDDVFLGEKSYQIERPRQEVLHRLLKLHSLFEKNGHTFNIVLGGQYNNRREFDIVRDPALTKPQISLGLTTFSEDLNYSHPVFKNFRGTAGVSLQQQDNSYSGRYLIPNYFASSYGAYWIEKWSKANWELDGGVRFDHRLISTRRMKFGGEEIDHDFRFSTLASSFSAGYRPSQVLKINTSVSLSSRAPHVNELLIDGLHQGAGSYSYIQGNINLKTEKSLNIGLGATVQDHSGHFSAEAFLYHNIIRDFIFQQPLPDSPVLTTSGAAIRTVYRQTNATLSGADLSLIYRISEHLQLSSKLSMLRARDRNTRDWLILMPSDRWRNEVRYQFRNGKRFSEPALSVEWMHVFEPRTPSDRVTKQDYKAPPGAYSLLNFDASAVVKIAGRPVTLGIGGRNLLNTVYRDYLNAFRYFADEMGRNITFRVKLPFDNILN